MQRSLAAAVGVSLLALTCATAPAAAQVLYGSALGIVEDQSSAAVVGADVTITNRSTGTVRETKSGADGRYTFPNLLPGNYEVKVIAPGFRTYSQANVQITINTVTRVDVKLELGQVTE